MKKRDIANVLAAAKQVKVAKIENKAIRNAFIRVHLFLLKAARSFSEAVEDVQLAHMAAYGQEQEEIVKLQNEMQRSTPARAREISAEIASHKDYLLATKQANETIAAMGREEVEIERIPMEEFVEELEKQGYDPAIMEGLFPLFNE